VTWSSPSLLVVVGAGLMGEDHSGAPNRDAFAIPHDIDRLGRNAIELREGALDGSAVDVGLIHFPSLVDASPP
jgi:hypothetical protein